MKKIRELHGMETEMLRYKNIAESLNKLKDEHRKLEGKYKRLNTDYFELDKAYKRLKYENK